MAIDQHKDVEDGLEKPFIHKAKCLDSDQQNGSISMVLLSTCVAVCGSFQFGSCVGYSSPTQSAIRQDLNLSISEFSMFGSIITIGAMIGAVTSGRLADYIGRKGAMRMSAVFCITGWLAVYFAMEALFLDVGRFCTGYGIGIFSYVVPVFIAEIAPKNLRGGLATLNQLMIVCGASTAYIVGSVVTWRTLALTGLIPCLLILVGLFFIPESPRWLAKVGRKKEFESALHRLCGRNADIMQEANEIQANIHVLLDQPKVRIVDLFDHKYIRPVTVGVGLMVFQQFGGINGIGFYSSETFVAAGFSSGKAGTIAYAIIQVPITMVGAVLMDKSGRRSLLMISSAGTCLGCILTGASFFLKEQDVLAECVPFLAVSGVLVYISAFSIGTGPVPWVVMSEIFPIHIKGVAGSLVVLVNWLGAWLVSFTFNYMMAWSSAGTFLIYAAFCALTIVFVAKIMPETKGKTLEEIQASLSS
ncbi:sugar transporter ERD6-like 16 [Salvia divinorum]|uniref:Sugar transporter ERD6-like 16 n=1 Tax=Salvia divinorum TaxID=28513 RepID=A0ABD1GXN8_SALDI